MKCTSQAHTLAHTPSFLQVLPLRLNIIVPDCGDGEVYIDELHMACRT